MRLNIACCFLYLILACCWGKCLCIPQQLIEELQSSLLPLFGLKERPKIDGVKVQVPEAIKKLYQMQNEFDLDTTSFPLPGLHTQSANTVRSFTHVESPIDERFRSHHKFRLKFDLSAIPNTEKLKAAEIRLRQVAVGDGGKSVHRIVVHDIICRGVKQKSIKALTRVIESKLVDGGAVGTVSLDVLPAVQRWVQDPSANHGVIVEVFTPKKQRHNIRLKRDLSETDWGAKQPLLLTYTDDGRNKQKSGEDLTTMRKRRTPSKRGHRKRDRDPCRRRQMYVDFRDVGWNDWIVAPLGYDAFYCGGECEFPMAEHMNTTNHAIIQAVMNSMQPNNVPKPCCVPTQLSSMSMLYVDSTNTVILKNYREMVVTGCGCR